MRKKRHIPLRKRIFRVFFHDTRPLSVIILIILASGLLIYIKVYVEKARQDKISEFRYEEPEIYQVNRLTPKPSITPVAGQLKLPVIMYHYVEPIKDPSRLNLTVVPSMFEDQVKALYKNGYKTLFAADIPKILSGSTTYDPKSVVLTFDDGYEDFYTTVFPLLKKYQMKGTVYVIYDFINRPGFLKESEIKELIASGIVEIGSHTLDHKYLKTETLEEAKRQITDSKQKFEDAFGIKIRTFAYPFGAYNSEDADMVKDASYEAAFTTKPGAMMSNDAKFVLPRIRPDRYTNDSIVQGLEEYDK